MGRVEMVDVVVVVVVVGEVEIVWKIDPFF